jgi:hypothetical protein
MIKSEGRFKTIRISPLVAVCFYLFSEYGYEMAPLLNKPNCNSADTVYIIYTGLFFWRNAPEQRSGTYLKEQNSKKAKKKNNNK